MSFAIRNAPAKRSAAFLLLRIAQVTEAQNQVCKFVREREP